MKYVLVHPHRVGYERNFYNEFCLSGLRVDRVELGFVSCTFKVPPRLINIDGGFATYELTRSYQWLELINPAETFGDIVIVYPFCYFEQFFNMAISVSITEELALCCHFLLGMDPGASASVMQDSFTYKKESINKSSSTDSSWLLQELMAMLVISLTCWYEEVDKKAKALRAAASFAPSEDASSEDASAVDE
ncbi:Detected protein of unknown function [Hibiscus syriacus]|uniref:Uncharacterized protein n=1 Tax=Hibiscus syriacus TaxID=106335 RepID=A0A6A3BUS6_HIBSY|nr:Detected protein of unknown function [Hibiscus syriacus]